jgi:hypothetical protein
MFADILINIHLLILALREEEDDIVSLAEHSKQ